MNAGNAAGEPQRVTRGYRGRRAFRPGSEAVAYLAAEQNIPRILAGDADPTELLAAERRRQQRSREERLREASTAQRASAGELGGDAGDAGEGTDPDRYVQFSDDQFAPEDDGEGPEAGAERSRQWYEEQRPPHH